MAVDPKDDDETDDDKELSAERKARAARHLLKSQRTVETALDDFIARANEKILDVSSFDAAAREQQLQAEIAELKRKLADADALPKATATAGVERSEPAPVVETRLEWAPVIGAFILGCGVMFAINLATNPDVAPVQTAAPTHPAPPQPTAATTARPLVEPAPQPPTTSTSEVAEANPTPLTETPALKQPKQVKQPRQSATTRPATTTPETTSPATTPPKATSQQGSGSAELYNPF